MPWFRCRFPDVNDGGVERCGRGYSRDNEGTEDAPTARGYWPPSRQQLSGCCGTCGLCEGPGDCLAELQTEDFHEGAVLDDGGAGDRHIRDRGGGWLAEVGQRELGQGTRGPLGTHLGFLTRSGNRGGGAAGGPEERRRLEGVHCVEDGSEVARCRVGSAGGVEQRQRCASLVVYICGSMEELEVNLVPTEQATWIRWQVPVNLAHRDDRVIPG